MILLTSLSSCNMSSVERTGQQHKPQHGWIWLNLNSLLRWLCLLSVLCLRLQAQQHSCNRPASRALLSHPQPPSPAFCLCTSEIPLPNWSSCALYPHRLGVRGHWVHLETQNAPDSFTRLWVAFLVVYIFLVSISVPLNSEEGAVPFPPNVL